MNNIAIIALSYGWLPGEGGTTRFSYLAEMLEDQGYNVTLISSSFYHIKKIPRDIVKLTAVEYPYKLYFLKEPGYKKNVSLKRLYSHYMAAKELKKHLEVSNYDLIYCVLPPNSLAKVAATYAKRRRIPIVIDVEDLWPEGWKMVFGDNWLTNLFFYPIEKIAEKAYQQADGIVGTSQEYTNRAFKNQPQKKEKIPFETVYVCMDIKKFDEGVKKYSAEIEKPENELWITYAGSLGTSYDIPTLIKAGQELYRQGYHNIKFWILGTGPNKESWEKMAKEYPCNIQFAGYIPYPQMAAWLYKSDILVNSVVKKSPASIITKIGDYLASGRPMINTCRSEEFRKMVQIEDFGVNVEAENVKELVQAIILLSRDDSLRQEKGNRGRKLAESQFDRSVANEAI